MEIVFGQMASVSQAQVFIFCLFWLSPKHKSQESQRHHHLPAPPRAPPYLDLIQNAASLSSSWASLGLVAPLLMGIPRLGARHRQMEMTIHYWMEMVNLQPGAIVIPPAPLIKVYFLLLRFSIIPPFLICNHFRNLLQHLYLLHHIRI